MRTSLRLFAAMSAAALFATACGETPDEQTSPTDTGSPTPEVSFAACQVTDTGGVDDRSFNQTAYKGALDAEAELGVEARVLESQAETDYQPNIDSFIAQGCDLIITVGFLLGTATQESAEANPDQQFAIVDYAYEETIPNVLGLVFATDEAAFLAGYLAAGMTETGTVGTYGGLNIPTVTIFMNGMLAGIRHYNDQHGTDVDLLGWDGSDGLFTDDFEDLSKGRAITDTLLQEGADIIMPVAGVVGGGSAEAINAAGRGRLIWVDTDGFESTQFGDLILTSVVKNMDVAVFEAIQAALDGTFAGGTFVGTLDNDGVGLAPFHDFDAEVSQELKDEIEALRLEIIDGSRSVDPADYA